MEREYKVIMRSSVSKLEKDVNALLAQGYELQGGVTLERFFLRKFYLQAVCKRPKL